MPMDEGRALACAAMLGRPLECRVGDDRSVPSILQNGSWEIADQPGNVAARRLHFHRNGDGVPVVFNHEDDGSFRLDAVFIASQNSPSLVVPSPSET